MIRFFLCFILSAATVQAQTILQNLKEPFTKYQVSTIACTRIVHPSGTIIFIPDLAFAVDTGEVPQVDLFYREMNGPVAMVVHEFNMVTELMNRQHHLESNGMFEIFATHGDDTVQVHEDRSIFVHYAMQPNNVDPLMEAFKYNVEHDRWDSYNRIASHFINASDDDLWGSTPASTSETSIEQSEEGEWVETEMSPDTAIKNVAFQAMEIFEFGIFNYDKIISGEVYIPVVASFLGQKGNTLHSKVYIVYEGINSVFYFDEYTWKSDFFIIKDRAYSMFTIDKNGEIYKLRNYPELTGDQEQQITFKLINEGPIPDTKSKLSNTIARR